jgi:hypothetical protein
MPSQGTGSKTPDGSARGHSVDRRSRGEENLIAAVGVDGDDMERDRRLLECLDLEVPREQSTQTGVRNEVVPSTDEAYEAGQRVGGVDRRAADPAPDRGELVRRFKRALYERGVAPDFIVGTSAGLSTVRTSPLGAEWMAPRLAPPERTNAVVMRRLRCAGVRCLLSVGGARLLSSLTRGSDLLADLR